MSVLPMWPSVSTVPPARITVLRPRSPGSPPANPKGAWIRLGEMAGRLVLG